MKFDTKRLFNGEVKLHFLEDYGVGESTKNTLYNTFTRTKGIEVQVGKDLYEMTDEELEQVLYGANITSEISMVAFYSNIRTYTKWCANYYGGSDFERFGGIHFSKIANKYVNKMGRTFFTQQDLLDKYEIMVNNSDKLIIQSIFEGLSGKQRSEIVNLKITDTKEIDGKYYVDLYDTVSNVIRKDFEISNILYDLIVKANKETQYMNDKNQQQPLVLNDYVIRKTGKGRKSKNENEPIRQSVIYSRANTYKEIFKPDVFNFSFIESSGIMSYLYELIKDQEGEVKQVNFTHLTKISDRYNIAKYTHSITLEETISYSFIKARIDKAFFEENYCKFEYVKCK